MKSLNHLTVLLLVGVLSLGGMTALSSCGEDLPDAPQEEPTKLPGGEEKPGEEPGGETPEPPAPIVKSRDINLSVGEKSLADATIANSFRILRLQSEIERQALEPKANIMISPLSLYWALSMVANGAAGESRAEIIRGLGFEGHSMAEINDFFHKLYGELSTLDDNSKLKIAGSLWFQNDIKPHLLNSFVDCVDKYYSAPVDFVSSFNNEADRAKINGWAKDATDNFISGIISGVYPDNLDCLFANLQYFKGNWAVPFDTKMTLEAPFHNEDGTSSTVRMMNAEEMNYEVVKGEGFYALKLPYGNLAFSMTIVLPDKGLNLDECLAQMESQSAKLTALARGETHNDSHIVSLPVFDITYESDLREVISEKLLIRNAFSQDDADLSSMFDTAKAGRKLHLDFPVQACKIKVDETGTEASAVTFVNGAEGVNDNLYFTVNRPFAFIISERSTGLPIFMGRVTKF